VTTDGRIQRLDTNFLDLRGLTFVTSANRRFRKYALFFRLFRGMISDMTMYRQSTACTCNAFRKSIRAQRRNEAM